MRVRAEVVGEISGLLISLDRMEVGGGGGVSIHWMCWSVLANPTCREMARLLSRHRSCRAHVLTLAFSEPLKLGISSDPTSLVLENPLMLFSIVEEKDWFYVVGLDL